MLPTLFYWAGAALHSLFIDARETGGLSDSTWVDVCEARVLTPLFSSLKKIF